jgi:hypothetical protein
MKRKAIIIILSVIAILIATFEFGTQIEVNTDSFHFRRKGFIKIRSTNLKIAQWGNDVWDIRSVHFSIPDLETSSKDTWELYKEWTWGNNPGETEAEHDLYCFKGQTSLEVSELVRRGKIKEAKAHWINKFRKIKANQGIDPTEYGD